MNYKHDLKTTYCYLLEQAYTEKWPTNDPNKLRGNATGAGCPLEIQVQVADITDQSEFIKLKYTVHKNTAFQSTPTFEGFEWHQVTRATPPTTLPTTASRAADEFDIPVAHVVLCDWRQCNLFQMDITGNVRMSENDPNNFDLPDKVQHVFGSQGLQLDKKGKYTGMAHISLPLVASSSSASSSSSPPRRADFVTYFPVQIGKPAGNDQQSIVSDVTYCFGSDASPFDPDFDDTLVKTIQSGAFCPGQLAMTYPKQQPLVVKQEFPIHSVFQLLNAPNAQVASTWLAQIDPNQFMTDPITKDKVQVARAVISTCHQESKGKCSAFSKPGSNTKDVYTLAAGQNLTSDATATRGHTLAFSTTMALDDPGEYQIITKVTMQGIDGQRVDFALYETVIVQADVTAASSSSSSSSTFLYIGLGLGIFILLLGLGICWWRRKRQAQWAKEMPFGNPEVDAMGSDFLAYKTPAEMESMGLGLGMNGRNDVNAIQLGADCDSTAFATAGGSNRPLRDTNESFSLDPYARDSFHEMGIDGTTMMHESSGPPTTTSMFHSDLSYSSSLDDDDSEWDNNSNNAITPLPALKESQLRQQQQQQQQDSPQQMHRRPDIELAQRHHHHHHHQQQQQQQQPARLETTNSKTSWDDDSTRTYHY